MPINNVTTITTVPITPWSKLEFWVRHSNLAAAAHGPFKARILDIKIGLQDRRRSMRDKQEPDLVIEISPSDFECGRRAEHNRWMAERLLTGWRYAATDDDQRKHRRQLIPYEDFPESLQDQWDEEALKDSVQLKAFLEFHGLDDPDLGAESCDSNA